MQRPAAVIFDLDNTLSEPFQRAESATLQRLEKILAAVPVAIMSAASLARINDEVIAGMQGALDRLTLFTANAAQCYRFEHGAWSPAYRFAFTSEEKAHVREALEETARECGFADERAYGKQFVDYEGYVAFSAVGVEAPREVRRAWDPDFSKRMRMRAILLTKLPEFDVYVGGATSIDVTPKDINKAYGVRWFAKHLTVPIEEILYIGDALYEGGNDAVVIPTGVRTRAVANPAETQGVMDEILASLS